MVSMVIKVETLGGSRGGLVSSQISKFGLKISNYLFCSSLVYERYFHVQMCTFRDQLSYWTEKKSSLWDDDHWTKILSSPL